jgi:membrane associated rhomboid family serine protease
MQTSARGGRTGFFTAIIAMAVLVVGMWLLEGLDQASNNALDVYGIRPRTGEGLLGVFIAPWLHGGWPHLISNTIPFFVLGVLVLLDGWAQWFRTTLVVVLVSGAAVWLLAPPGSITLGASGVVFGWLTYLVVRGFYTGSAGQIVLGLVIFLLYGGMLWGVLPTDTAVSWQAHLGGALGGFLAARSRRRARAIRSPTPTYRR